MPSTLAKNLNAPANHTQERIKAAGIDMPSVPAISGAALILTLTLQPRGPAAVQIPHHSGWRTAGTLFGTTVAANSGFRGEIYHIDPGSQKLPNFSKLKPVRHNLYAAIAAV